MAIIKNGILGGIKGKAGAVVGYHLNGQDIIRGMPKERTKKATPGELANRLKFAVSQAWLQPLLEFLRVGFQGYAPTYGGFVAAKSYNSKNALRGTDPDFFIDPAFALVSFGKMDPATTATAVSESPNTISFTWSGGRHTHDDRAMYVVYDIEKGYAAFETAGVKRQMEKGTFEVSPYFSGKEVHIYLAFVSEDRKERSNSQYLGKLTVM